MTTSKGTTRRPRLSAAMIVRNEQDWLAGSIESVRPLADEIVVLDTGSADQTPGIAQRLGAVVVRSPWADDFSAARNACLEHVSGDWVLWLDAGETLAEGSAGDLRAFVDRQAGPGKVYTLMIEVSPADKAGCGEQVARPRLMPSRAGLKFEGRVRETLLPAMAALGLTVEVAPGRILRGERQHDLALKTLKAHRDLALADLECAEGVDPSSRLLLAKGEAYCNLGLHEQAQDALRKAVEASPKGSTDMLEAYYGLLTAMDSDPLLRDEQLRVCLAALEVFPLDTQLLLAMGNYLQNRQRLDLAVRAFETAVTHGQVNLSAWHMTELAEVAASCYCLILQTQGRQDDARGVLEEALKRHERSPRLLRHLIDLHAKHGRCDEAIDLVGRLPLRPGQAEWFCDAIRGACKAVANDWTAALGHLQSAYAAGCRDPFLLRWLAVTFLSNGQVEAAQPILSEWYGVEPNNAELRIYRTTLEGLEGATAQHGQAAETDTDEAAGRTLRVDQPAAHFEVAPPQPPPKQAATRGTPRSRGEHKL